MSSGNLLPSIIIPYKKPGPREKHHAAINLDGGNISVPLTLLIKTGPGNVFNNDTNTDLTP